MKKYAGLYLFLAATLIGGFALFAVFRQMPAEQPVDMLAINDIVKSAEQYWPDPSAIHGENFSYRVALIDRSEQLVWATDRDVAQSVNEAVRRRYTILDVTVDGQVVGKALIETFSEERYLRIRQRFSRLALLSVLLLCAVSLLYLLGLHRTMIRPFQRLETFARRIAAGNLDEPLPMDKGNLFGLFTESFDLMRASLLEAKQSRLQAEKAKKELIATLSHDIKTPVTSIQLVAELLLAGSPEPAMAEKLGTIEEKAAQITRLMNDMLHSSMEELGELAVAPTSETSETLRRLILAADQQGLTRAGPVPPCMIEIDMPRMEQVAGNIISNSHKYAGTEIDAVFRVDGGYLCAEVSDYGPGVPEEEIDRICTKFYRGRDAKSSRKGGEGLGLYIARLLMEKMGGGLEVYSRPDGFTVKLMLRLS